LIDRWKSLTRPSKVLLLLGASLLLLAYTGFLRADSGLQVSASEATDIAEERIDFVPEETQVRLIRQGFNLRPVWAVSLAIPIEGTSEFERLATVEVDAVTGQVLRVVASRG
jgi:hypothetical protein